MPRFFVQEEQIRDGIVTLSGEDAHHISRSLRMAAGEKITVCDPQGTAYECELTGFFPDIVTATVKTACRDEAEPPYRVTVYQALPKGDKLDQVIQKAVECGAAGLVPFESSRCVVRAKAETEEKKRERRQKISLEAAKQCGRGMVPQVGLTISFRDALRDAVQADTPLFCYEGEKTVSLAAALSERLKTVPPERAPLTLSLMVGSEGGFSPEEAEEAVRAGMIPVGLGKRILRTETAASFALSCFVYALEM